MVGGTLVSQEFSMCSFSIDVENRVSKVPSLMSLIGVSTIFSSLMVRLLNWILKMYVLGTIFSCSNISNWKKLPNQ